ncbi:Hint domain-containing protein [Jannaschia sp. M317]|uniref:Hint domain-containing protein n=1 Tax=Jannaschia sp. M317 TaxID=2867011 RepID=UPI0021A30EE4|nr:Hint domain-containing protein [Jannaschia sp. M317]UWQ17544.1 Hint domain-containing protein [Jannaschia sp. M317]
MLGTCAQAQVISAHQVRVDGRSLSTLYPFPIHSTFRWTGPTQRLDGARAALLLSDGAGFAELRNRVPGTVAKLTRSRGEIARPFPADPGDTARALILSDGITRWQARPCVTAAGEMLLLFAGNLPPCDTDLTIVQAAKAPTPATPRDTICFTPGTRILTEDGPRPVEALYPGDRVLTRDDGPQELLWMGVHQIPETRLAQAPHLRPIRIRAGALGEGEPQPDLFVSPGHQVMLTGPKARALWGEPEVLVRARDLIDDHRVTRDFRPGEVTYIHLLFARHQILWANRVEVESFHPGDAELDHLTADELSGLHRHAPGIDRDPSTYGAHARRCLTGAEVAILRSEGTPRYLS